MKINKLTLFGLLISLVLGMTTVHAQESQTDVAITLERTACFGACPVYTLTILEDGTVLYNGERFVSVTGEQRGEIDAETVVMMIEAFEAAGYFDWNAEYTTQTVTDMPTVITSVTRNGETHRIVRYGGDNSAPLALSFLENWVDVMANSQMWTGVQPDPASISNGMNTPLATLQRTPCFGFCPVYSVAVYEDGTIVFTGIANVEEIGVRIFQVEPAAVSSVAVRAGSLGYFNWSDSYETQVMTDQATVITSISTTDQYKRIVRYDGDPNAPVGLVWVEEIIDQFVTELVG